MAWLVTVVGPWHRLLSLVVPLLHLSCGWHRLPRLGDPSSPAPLCLGSSWLLAISSWTGAEEVLNLQLPIMFVVIYSSRGCSKQDHLSVLLESAFSVPYRPCKGSWHRGDPPVVSPAPAA